jgi:RNA polymerase sigma-70 factor (ECF subfamily)
MTDPTPDTEELLRRAAAGDPEARATVLEQHRERLRRMIAVRIDPRLAARIDPSDVVQETLAEADRLLAGYVQSPPLPFYPWLRQLAWDQIVHQHRLHIQARRRTVSREEPVPLGLPGESVLALADRLLACAPSPSAVATREEIRDRVQAALGTLGEEDREVLALRYLEGLSARAVGEVLGVSEAAAKKRALRALRRLRDLLATKEERHEPS